jgi:hypothetical protein
VLERVLVDKTIEVLLQLASDFGGSTGARAIHQPLRALVGKAMDPLAQGGIRKLERVGDGLQTLAFDDGAYGLGTAEETCLFGLLQERISSGQGVIGKVQCKGPPMRGLQNKILQKYKHPTSPHVAPLL